MLSLWWSSMNFKFQWIHAELNTATKSQKYAISTVSAEIVTSKKIIKSEYL